MSLFLFGLKTRSTHALPEVFRWVASTFSHKPYFFNRENLERYTEGVYCRQCPLYCHCDFEGSYEELEQRLFPLAEFSNDRGSQSWQRGKKRR